MVKTLTLSNLILRGREKGGGNAHTPRRRGGEELPIEKFKAT